MNLNMCAYSVDHLENGFISEVKFFNWNSYHNLHYWMENLYRFKGGKEKEFNQIPIELSKNDILNLEKTIEHKMLGTPWVNMSNDSYDEQTIKNDLKFTKCAMEYILNNKKIYYKSVDVF